MEYTEKKIKALTDRELQCLEHDNEVDLIHDLSFSTYLSDVSKWVAKEMKRRNLKELPRLNGFN